jgi:hypothetical protein
MLGWFKMDIKKVFLTSAVVASSLLLGAEKQEFNYLADVLTGHIERSAPVSQKFLQNLANLADLLDIGKTIGSTQLGSLKEPFVNATKNKDYLITLFGDIDQLDRPDVKTFILINILSRLEEDRGREELF